jgi:hypothetical protein
MDQTVESVKFGGLTEPFDDIPVVLPNSEPLRLMPETPLELRVPEKAINVGTFRDVNIRNNAQNK